MPCFEAKIPGKIMLAGEYAVLKGGAALATAVDCYLALQIESSKSEGVWIESNIWTEPKLLTPGEQREPLLDSLSSLITHNVRVKVQSEFPISFGLGSSSAVRLAAHLCAHAYRQSSINLSYEERLLAAREAWHRQRHEQGFASGYDLVTQLQGGLVLFKPDYENWPGTVLSQSSDWLKEFVHPYVGGQGAPTTTVGGGVRSYLDTNGLWPRLLEQSEVLVDAFQRAESEAVIQATANHRQIFEPGPFYPTKLRNLLASLPDFDRSWSFKTTGAGGEDAILLLGSRPALQKADELMRREGWRPLPYDFTEHGARLAKKEWDA